jgi:putative colanic acid biosynthesis glycosyltransferase
MTSYLGENVKEKKISIITVTYNNILGLQDTFHSVKGQSFNNYEHIVIDGGSKDGTVEFLNRQSNNRKLIYLSEIDTGIFNAMNKGIALANGDWLLFLNAGDTFPTDSTLENLAITGVFEDDGLDLIYGDKLDSEGRIIKAKRELFCLYFGEMPACHQSIFFRNNIRYDESFKIFGDIDLLSRIYLSQPNYKYVETPISIFEGGGVSSNITWIKRKEKFRSLFKNFGLLCLLRNYILKFSFYKKIFYLK